MSSKSLEQHFELLKLSGINDIFVKPENDTDSIIDLEQLRTRYTGCNNCALAENRIKLVYGEGSNNSKLMLIGEGPGADENVTGKPFVGKAGQLLTKMLNAINISRDEVYITNIVKCRPPSNRNPLPEEISACLPLLIEQIEAIKPDLLLLLGKVASETLLRQNKSLTNYRANIHYFNGIKTYATYHPSALLRNPSWKKYAWVDLQKLRDDYNGL